jgi:hypothetical protein
MFKDLVTNIPKWCRVQFESQSRIIARIKFTEILYWFHIYIKERQLYNSSRGTFTVFTVFRLLTDFVSLYTYEFWLSLCKIARSSVILLLPLFSLGNWFISRFLTITLSSKLIHIAILYIHLHHLPHSIIIIVKFANRKIKIREKPRLVLPL